MAAASELPVISLDPDPVIEAYKKDVDRTLIRENLKLTVDERRQEDDRCTPVGRGDPTIDEDHEMTDFERCSQRS